jgi:tetratricopeptide (TPR) repeat protein
VWLGELQLGGGNLAEAERHLQKVLQLQPESPAALSLLGRVALERRDYPRAIAHLEHALRVAPGAAGVQYPLAMAYRGAGQLADAEAHLKRAGDTRSIAPPDPLMDAVSRALGNAGAFEARGMEALDRRDWPAAVANLREAVRIAPDNAVTRLNLGTALSLSGDSVAAREQYLAALNIDPSLARAHFALGAIALEEQRADEALERFAAAIKYDPDFLDARFMLAEQLRHHGRAEEALAHYEQVLKVNTAASQARFGAAMALVRLRRYIAARDRLDEGMRLHPDQPGFPHALARVLAAAPEAPARDGRRALMIMEQLLASYQSVAAFETMAMALAEVGRFREAVDWQQRAIASARQAGQPDLAARMRDNLTLYERERPCRTPWREGDPALG